MLKHVQAAMAVAAGVLAVRVSGGGCETKTMGVKGFGMELSRICAC